ncbi:MAG TPA: hypothetical protein VH328_02600 [Burkholderiaceae bacterium]|nr:hypothetical protein [Burkholderiaceae bacterium]
MTTLPASSPVGRIALPGGAGAAPRLAFVEVKAFGDLTITAASLRRLPPALRERIVLVAGDHLADLCRVLAPGCAIELVETGGRDVPALFDVKKHGLRAGAIAGWRLRRAVARSAAGCRLVFEKLTRRERFVAGRRAAVCVPKSANVYQAYETFLEEAYPGVQLAPITDADADAPPTGRRIGLFPLTRVAAKNLAPAFVATLARQCMARGFEPVVVLLEGESFAAPTDLACHVIPRRFDALAAEIRSLAAAVCADSLPAHLVAYAGRPVFVASPVPNEYWFPLSSFTGHHWGLIDEPQALAAALERFLQTLPPATAAS